MKSMTGYAKRQCRLGSKTYSIELKTLNSKQLDTAVKMPASLRSYELEVRTLIGRLERGKIDLCITEDDEAQGSSRLNEALLRARFGSLQQAAIDLGQPTDHLLERIATMPDVWNAATDDELSAEAWQTLKAAIEATLDDCDHFRAHEGAILQADIAKHVDCIEDRLRRVPQFEAERMEVVKDRMHKYLAELQIDNVDSNRFEQELAYYLEKLDITEEKVRLAKHIDYFRATVATEETCGKKLGFICQEMGREINTTGSKANHVELQRLVVEMKDELEKIKEQLGNIL